MSRTIPTLFSHQMEFYQFFNHESILILPTGTGKTICSVAPLVNNKLVFLCPSIIADQIKNTLINLFNIETLSVKDIVPKKRRDIYEEFDESKNKALILPYPLLINDYKFIMNKGIFTKNNLAFICDEASILANPKNKSYKLIKAIFSVNIQAPKILMTATIGDPVKLHTMLSVFQNPMPFKEFSQYVRWEQIKINRYRTISRPVEFKNIKQFMNHPKISSKVFIRNKSEMDISLPSFVVHEYNVKHTSIYKQAYNRAIEYFADDFLNRYKSDKYAQIQIDLSLITLVYLAPHLVIGDPKKYPPKYLDILSLLKIRENENFIIYSNFLYPLNDLKEFLESKGIQTLLVSSESKDAKSQIESFIKKPNQKVLLGTSSISHGIDGLQKHFNNIVFPNPATYEAYQQASGRISRIGSDHTVANIHLFIVEDSIEKTLWQKTMNRLILMDQMNIEMTEGLIYKPFLEPNKSPDNWETVKLKEYREILEATQKLINKKRLKNS